MGGIAGLIVVVTMPLETLLLYKATTLYVLASYTLSTAAGILLLMQKRIGTTLSMLVQLIQIPYLALKGFQYQLISGIELSLGVEFPPFIGFPISFHLTSAIGIGFSTNQNSLLNRGEHRCTSDFASFDTRI